MIITQAICFSAIYKKWLVLGYGSSKKKQTDNSGNKSWWQYQRFFFQTFKMIDKSTEICAGLLFVKNNLFIGTDKKLLPEF